MEVDGNISPYVLSAEKVLQGLGDLRNQVLLCDVHLVAENETFPVHRVVLAAASPYFQAMFSGGFKENDMDSITLEEVSAKGLKCVLDAIYTTNINLSNENVDLVLSVANLMQMDEIVKACETFMVDNMTVENCLRFMNISEKFELESVVERAGEFMFEVSCESFAAAPEFDELSQENVCKYLSDDLLQTPEGEFEVFRAAVKWIEKRRCVREVNVPEILQHVRFPFIPHDVLLDTVLNHPLVNRFEKCQKLVKEALRFNYNIYSQPLQEGQQFRPRGDRRLVLIQSGNQQLSGSLFKVSDVEKNLHILQQTDDGIFIEDTTITHPGAIAVMSELLVCHNNYLFLFGTDNNSFNPVFLRYDITNNKWMDLKPPPQPATIGATAVKLHQEIYIFGGMYVQENDNDYIPERFTNRSFRYSIPGNDWTEVQGMPHPLVAHAAASHQDLIFVVGGTTDAAVLDSTWAYDSRADIWLRKSNMCQARGWVSLQAKDGYLYACGGIAGDSSFEIYNIYEDQWTIVECEARHGVFLDSFFLYEKLYIAGGRDGSDLVTCYDIRTKKLSQKRGALPFACVMHRCSILTVPRK